MIQIAGRYINPAHVSEVHVVEPQTRAEKKTQHKYEIEIMLLNGSKFFDWGRGTDDIREADDWARTLSKYVFDAQIRELAEATTATVKAAQKASE